MWLRKALLILLCSVSFVSYTQAANAVFQDTQDHLVDTKNLKGKWVIVNYWAEWCGPCVKEIPELNHFYKTNKDKNVILYGVYYERIPLEDLKLVAHNSHIDFPVLSEDPQKIWGLADVSILPTTFIVNPKGEMVKELYGASSEDNLLNALHEAQNSYLAAK